MKEIYRYVYETAFLSPEEVQQLVNTVKDIPFEFKPTHSCLEVTDISLSSQLSPRVQKIIPQKILDPVTKELWEYAGLDDTWTHYQFDKDQNTSAQYDAVENTKERHAKFMLEIYLQDDIQFGSTCLHHRQDPYPFLEVKPETGKVLIYGTQYRKAEDRLIAGLKHVICCPIWYRIIT
jgi:hypothetical protein